MPADDSRFGAVVIALDHEAGTLTVSGDGLPTVEVCRAPGTTAESHVPIGTRDPERLTLAVEGAEEALRPAKGFLTRRSYRVEVVSAWRRGYLLVPDSLGSARLLCDGPLLGVLTSSGGGSVTAQWETESDSSRTPEPYDASVGYALAAAFGTEAEPMWKLTLNVALELWP
ncbi:hypothetical protein [Streptomyces sp. NPDC048248]|uniref:hypothetical protein n=1 Tax=Streptomyces sp. NPDC048248 TaxID=3365523 RepID=UPI00371BBFFB